MNTRIPNRYNVAVTLLQELQQDNQKRTKPMGLATLHKRLNLIMQELSGAMCPICNEKLHYESSMEYDNEKLQDLLVEMQNTDTTLNLEERSATVPVPSREDTMLDYLYANNKEICNER